MITDAASLGKDRVLLAASVASLPKEPLGPGGCCDSDPWADVSHEVSVDPVDGTAFSSCPKGGESSLAFPRYL